MQESRMAEIQSSPHRRYSNNEYVIDKYCFNHFGVLLHKSKDSKLKCATIDEAIEFGIPSDLTQQQDPQSPKTKEHMHSSHSHIMEF